MNEQSDIKQFLLYCFQGVTILCLMIASLISLNHLFQRFPLLSQLSTEALGWFGWGSLILAIIVLGQKSYQVLIATILLFFLMGYQLGSFLVPAADPVEHLRRVYELNCNSVAKKQIRENSGIWQYSMAGVVLCPDEIPVQPENVLHRIDITNGLFWGLLAGALFVLGAKAGLQNKWAFFSVVMCFLFFGTNKFSYFRYYSFAPSCTSLVIFWLWTATFFFKKKCIDVFWGVIIALLMLPILWVNHRQEAVFLGFIVIVWFLFAVFFNIGISFRKGKKNQKIWHRNRGGIFSVYSFYIISVCFVFCLLPQSVVFREWLSQFFVSEYGQAQQLFFLDWLDIFTGKQANALRVKDTLGLVVVATLFITIPYFWCGLRTASQERKVRIFVLAVLPFIGYFVPLFHFVWAANVKYAIYYRLCYVTMYWILFADFLSCLETHYLEYVEKSV